MNYYLVFDVESLGLHGEAFAFGACVINSEGNFELAFSLISKEGRKECEKMAETQPFFAEMLLALEDISTCETNRELRDAFFNWYQQCKNNYKGLQIWSDCNFPVETNFLSAIVKDGNGSRDWDMPYPLKDLSTIMDINLDRNEQSGLPDLKKHNPFDDAMASAKCLVNILHK